MKPKTSEQVLFIEFAASEHYDSLKPFSFVTSDDCRYDVEYDPGDGALIYHRCRFGRCYPVCYLEQSKHRYWAGEGIVVTENSGEAAPSENRVELPDEYRGRFDEWPDMAEA